MSVEQMLENQVETNEVDDTAKVDEDVNDDVVDVQDNDDSGADDFDQSKFLEGLLNEESKEVEDEPKTEEPKVEEPKAPEVEAKPKTPEEEDADLVSAIPSERGKERIQTLLRQGREHKAEVESYRRTIQESGLDQESFNNLLTITKLVSSGSPEEIERGLAALETVRGNLYKSLGREAPGVDLLNGHDDLKSKVDDMSMTREDALAIAKARQFQQEEARKRQQFEMAQRDAQVYKAKVDTFQQQAMTVFASKAKELDYEVKIKALTSHFAQPGVVERFVREVPPEQWLSTLEFMYNGIAAPKAAPKPSPIAGATAKSIGVRSRSTDKYDPEKSLQSMMESMGL